MYNAKIELITNAFLEHQNEDGLSVSQRLYSVLVFLPTYHDEDDDESHQVTSTLFQRRGEETHPFVEPQQLDELQCAEEHEEANHVAEGLQRSVVAKCHFCFLRDITGL